MRKSILIIYSAMLLLAVSCYDKEIEKINQRLDDIENVSIATLDQQVVAIKASIGSLEDVDDELQGYIDNLQAAAEALQSSIDATNENIERVEAELRTELETASENLSTEIVSAKTELLESLEALRTDTQGKLDQINAAIVALQAADVALGQRIDALKTYTDTEIQDAKNWVAGTFSTLEQYSQTLVEIAGIKANIYAINTSITELENRLNTKIARDIAQAVSTLEGELQQQATDITEAYTSAISQAKSEITSAYTSAIAAAIASSESSMRSWVNERLTGYYTIAEVNAKLQTLQQGLEGQLNSQKEYLEGLVSQLESNLTQRINSNKTLIDNLQGQVNGLSSDLSELAGTVATNSRDISANAEAIAANARSISANASNIETCNGLIAENKRLIDANTSAISANTSALSTLQNRVSVNEQAIATNVASIAQNAEDIALNASQIAANATAISNNARAISDNAGAIAQLRTDLNTAKSEITTAYQQAIASAITENNGVINARIAADIQIATNALQGQIDAVNTRIDGIESRISALEGDVANLIDMVQSIVVVPDYSDGSVICIKGFNEFYFEVLPSGLATSLAAAGPRIFTLKAVYTQTRSAHSFVSLPVCGVRAENDLLIITASGENLGDDIFKYLSANACLSVNSGMSSYSTSYFPLATVFAEAVDLGLSVKWASCNLGASSPEEYGYYYSWGETRTKRCYDWTTYLWGNGEANQLNKYCYSSDYGTIDNKRQLEADDDMAHVLLGGAWRMPTKDETQELLDNCSCEFTDFRGARGVRLTSRLNGNSIFIPAAGRFQGEVHNHIDARGYCWTSSVHSGDPRSGWGLRFMQGTSEISIEGNGRYFGQAIRPVMDDMPTPTQCEKVDLGLSVKWASCNLGASSPEEYGDYYAWGETEPKDEYGCSTYKFGSSEDGPFSKYNTKSQYGTVDNKTVLDSEDDAASAKLGGKWRMPTYVEWLALKNKCVWTWTTQNGVNGRLITASNGNSIFLPAAGYRDNTSLNDAGIFGCYWSSSLEADRPTFAWYFDFNSENSYRITIDRRYRGQPIRPVYEE